MRKANKIPFIVLLCFAIAFIAATLALLFIPEPTPLKITEKPTVTIVDGEYVFHGKLKNVSNDELVLQSTSFCVKISKTYENGTKAVSDVKPNLQIFLKPDEEFDLSALNPAISAAQQVQSVKIDKIIFTPDHTDITIYGNVVNNGKFSVYALFTGIAGAGFLLIAICSYVTEVRNTKRVNNIISQIRQTFENGVYAEGYYGNKTQTRTAAAKTTASVIGAIISSVIFGLGRYKIYSQSAKNEFIITETSIYTYINGKFINVTNEIISAFVNPSVTEKRNKIYVKGDGKNVCLIVRTDSANKAETLNYLKNIFENRAQPENTQGLNNGETN